MGAMQYLTFRLNGVEYAVDVKIVETVVEYSAVTAIPTPVEYMKGVMDLRGQVIPIIDLRKKFGLAENADEGHPFVIVIAVEDRDQKKVSIGVLVDAVSEVVTFAEDSVEAARTEGVAIWERYIRGIVRFEEHMVVLVEAEGLFSLKEIEALRAA